MTVSDSRYSLKAGIFLRDKWAIGILSGYEIQPDVISSNSILTGYDTRSAGLFSRRYFKVYKWFYFCLEGDVFFSEEKIIPTWVGKEKFSKLSAGLSLSLAFQPLPKWGFIVSNGWLNYTYVHNYKPTIYNPVSSFNGFNYGPTAETWTFEINYFFLRRPSH